MLAINVSRVSGEPLTRLALRGGQPVAEIRRLALAAAGLPADAACRLTASGAPTPREEVPLALSGLADEAHVTLVRVQRLWAVTASIDGTAKLWRVGGHDTHTLEVPAGQDGVASAAFSPDGRLVLTASSDGKARVWGADDREQLAVLAGHTGPVQSAAFSPDGRRVATASKDRTARIWRLEGSDATCEHVLGGHENSVWRTAFSPDGTMLLTASRDSTVRLWDPRSGTCLKTLRGHEAAVWSAVFSPDGRHIASASSDRTVKLWDVERGEHLRTLVGHESTVTGACFSSDGVELLTCSRDGTARVWNPETGVCNGVLEQDGQLWAAALSPDGEVLATAGSGGRLGLWRRGGDGSWAVTEVVCHHPQAVLGVDLCLR